MTDGSDFDWVVGKIPKVGADGRNVTADLLAAGGYRREDGTLSALVYGLRKIAPEPRPQPAETSPGTAASSGLRPEVVAGVIVAAFIGGVVAAPHVKRWWADRVTPFLRSVRPQNNPTGQRHEVASSAETVPVGTDSAALFRDAVDVAVRDVGQEMSRAEAERRLAVLLTAAAVVAEQLRALNGAKFAEADVALEFREAMATLSSAAVIEAVNRAVEAEHSLIDDALQAKLMRLFSDADDDKHRFWPLDPDRVRNSLQFPIKPAGEEPGTANAE